MDTEDEIDQLLLSQSDQIPKPKRLKKTDSIANNIPTCSAPSNEFDKLDKGDESDGLDPLFGDPNQFSAKRVLEFDGFGSEDDPDFEENEKKNEATKKRQSSVEIHGAKEKKRRVKSDVVKNKSLISHRKEKKVRIAAIRSVSCFYFL